MTIDWDPWHTVTVSALWFCEPDGSTDKCAETGESCKGHAEQAEDRYRELAFDVQHPAGGCGKHCTTQHEIYEQTADGIPQEPGLYLIRAYADGPYDGEYDGGIECKHVPGPMPGGRRKQIESLVREADGFKQWAYLTDEGDPAVQSSVTHLALAVPELLGEIDRLTAELAKWTHWEPTVKDEYEHACAVAERAEDAVREFKRAHEGLWTGPDQNDAVVAFVMALENALEIS